MTVLGRLVASTPRRSPVETWNAIADLVCSRSNERRTEFDKVSGVLAAVISDQVPAEHPVVVVGCGPRIRIRCIYGDDALDSDSCDERPVAIDPLGDAWTVYVPAAPDDLDWIKRELTKRSAHFVGYDGERGVPAEPERREAVVVEVDEEALTRL